MDKWQRDRSWTIINAGEDLNSKLKLQTPISKLLFIAVHSLQYHGWSWKEGTPMASTHVTIFYSME
jgi:hypothetical protein